MGWLTTTFTIATTDTMVLGIVTWISGTVTVGGFAIAIWQLARIKRAAEAAQLASEAMSRAERQREFVIRLTATSSHLRTAAHLLATNDDAARAYLDTARSSLVEASHLATSEDERNQLEDHTIVVGQLMRAAPSSNKIKAAQASVREVQASIEKLAAKLRYQPTSQEYPNGCA